MGQFQRITRMVQCFPLAALALWLGMLSSALPAFADEAPFGIIEQTIAVPFKPVSVYALVNFGAEKTRQFPGIFVSFPNQGGENAKGERVAVAALVSPLLQEKGASLPGDTPLRFTFFLASLDGEFAATEVSESTWAQLQQLPRSVDAIQAEVANLKKRIPQQRDRNSSLEKKFIQLRDQASQIAQVDDLLDLRTELETLKEDDKKSAEIARIRATLERGYNTPDGPLVPSIRSDLNDQLVLAARLTAFVDREANSKRMSAEQSYKRKIMLIQQTENIDAESLAQEALALRERRRALEQRLHGGAPERNADF